VAADAARSGMRAVGDQCCEAATSEASGDFCRWGFYRGV
jgi:hypothetical protein